MNVVAHAPPRPELVAGARPTAIVPKSMDEAYRLAKAVVMSGIAPKGDSAEACMIKIMHGLEVGLPPLAALQRIAVVNGRPVIWGDGAISLVRGSGLCEYINERIEGEGESTAAICEVQRRGEPEPIVRTFSVSDAKRAGLWGKSGPWQQYPARMLTMRARGFALRDGFADVLGGMYLREEIDEDERSSRAGNKPGQLLPPIETHDALRVKARAQHPPQPTPPSPPPPPPSPIPPQPEDGDEDWPPPPADEDTIETPPKDPMHEEGAADGPERQKLFEAGRGAAERGTNALLRWLNKLPPSQRELIGDTAIDLLRSIAKEAAPSPSP